MQQSELTSQSQKQEREHLERVCDSFRQYATFARCSRKGQANRILNLAPELRHSLPRAMIPGSPEYKAREEAMQEAELRNQYFFDSMLQHAGMPHSQDVASATSTISAEGHSGSSGKDHEMGEASIVTPGGANNTGEAPKIIIWSSDDSIEKVHSVLKSVTRDWSKDGAGERATSYGPILEGLQKYLPTRTVIETTSKEGGQAKQNTEGSVPVPSTRPSRVLVPGAGVGRLSLEVYSLGYEVQGNEFSLHMLLASDFILNGATTAKPFAISPWLSATRNICRADDPVRKVYVPDIDPASVMETLQAPPYQSEVTCTNINPEPPSLPDFSMAAGEFVSIYGKPEEKENWDAVASCFFLDTAPCIVEYIKVIWNCLVDGGVLINLGPLHYHWTGPPYRPDDLSFQHHIKKHSHLDKRYMQSVDMSWEDVREVLFNCGFDIVDERLGVKAKYTADARNFMNSDYRCVCFVARKTTKRSTTLSISK